MCAVCMSTPCPSQCPNAPEPPAIYDCANCREGIADGDEYTEIDGDFYHFDCLDAMTTAELLRLIGATTHTAEAETFPHW